MGRIASPTVTNGCRRGNLVAGDDHLISLNDSLGPSPVFVRAGDNKSGQLGICGNGWVAHRQAAAAMEVLDGKGSVRKEAGCSPLRRAAVATLFQFVHLKLVRISHLLIPLLFGRVEISLDFGKCSLSLRIVGDCLLSFIHVMCQGSIHLISLPQLRTKALKCVLRSTFRIKGLLFFDLFSEFVRVKA